MEGRGGKYRALCSIVFRFFFWLGFFVEVSRGVRG